MQRVATAITDASGRFVFSSANVDPSSFYLVQAVYQGVDYNAPAQFDPEGTASVAIAVFEASSSAPHPVSAGGGSCPRQQGARAGDVCGQESE
jgi:hypothetical protein